METALLQNRAATDKVLAEMLTENTGKSMSDSGNYYGRNWQRNAGRTVQDFLSEPLASYEAQIYDGKLHVYGRLSLFHWLREKLTYDEELTAELLELGESDEMEHESWFGVRNAFVERHGYKSEAVNSYNDGSCALDQHIEFCHLQIELQDYVVLMIHGGCDIRSGYTKPRVFSVGYFDFDRFEIQANEVDAPVWDQQGFVDVANGHAVDDLETYPTEIVDSYDELKACEAGVIYVARDGTWATCPVTGYKLEVWPHGY